MRRDMRSFLAACVILAVAAGCVDDPGAPTHFNPLDPDNPAEHFPGPPPGLVAYAGDGEVRLDWEVPPDGTAASYRVYRSNDTTGGGVFDRWDRIASPDSTGHVDRTVINNNEYRYKVTSVDSVGTQSEASAEVSVVPGVYTVTINGGAVVTRESQVTLAFTAPAGTQLVRVANDSTMASAAFVTLTPLMDWTLTPGDGPKNIYVEFRGPFGESSGRQHVAIELDTFAEIQSVAVTPAGTVLEPGDTLHLVIDADETGGTATIDIEERTTGIRLLDDGSRGDAVAGDGRYELDYLIPGGNDVGDADVIARFRDRAGNVAPALTAGTHVTIGIAPEAVHLQAPRDSTVTSLRLIWEMSEEDDFASYRLFRATAAGVDTASQRVLVTQPTSPGTVTFQDTGLTEDTQYYYLLYVYDRAGLFTASNEVTGRTANHLPPAVTMSPPTGISPTGLTLGWSESTATDFEAYRVYRAAAPGVDTTDVLLATITRREERTLAVTGLVENTRYYFRVFVRDRADLLGASNEIDEVTANLPPPPVVLATPTGVTQTTIDLSWSASTVHDFKEYRVYRDTTAAVTQTSEQIRVIDDRVTVAFTDAGLEENTTYYYRVYVADTGDSVAASEVESATTDNEPPGPVTLIQPDSLQVTSDSVHLTWSASTAHDFESYRLYRSLTPGVTPSSALRFTGNPAGHVFFDDVGLTGATDYYYRVFVVDSGALETGSNEIHVTTHP